MAERRDWGSPNRVRARQILRDLAVAKANGDYNSDKYAPKRDELKTLQEQYKVPEKARGGMVGDHDGSSAAMARGGSAFSAASIMKGKK